MNAQTNFQQFVKDNQGKKITFLHNDKQVSKVVQDVCADYFTGKNQESDAKIDGFYYFSDCKRIEEEHPLIDVLEKHKVVTLHFTNNVSSMFKYDKYDTYEYCIVGTCLTASQPLCFHPDSVKEAWAILYGKYTKVWEKQPSQAPVSSKPMDKLESYFEAQNSVKNACEKVNNTLEKLNNSFDKVFSTIEPSIDDEKNQVGFYKSYRLSPFLREFLGLKEDIKYVKNDITEKVIEYCMKHVNPKDKTKIIPDEKIYCLIGGEFGKQITFIDLQRKLDKHFLNDDTLTNKDILELLKNNKYVTVKTKTKVWKNFTFNSIEGRFVLGDCEGTPTVIPLNNIIAVEPSQEPVLSKEEYNNHFNPSQQQKNIKYRGKPKTVEIVNEYTHINGKEYVLVKDITDNGKTKTLFKEYIEWM